MKLVEKNDIKIFILYLLLNIKTNVDFGTLNDIVVQDDFVNQFDFMDCIYELLQLNQISETVVDNEKLYSITDNGIIAARTLQSDLLKELKEKSIRSAHQFLSSKIRGSKSTSSIEETKDGKFKFSCKIVDANGLLMETSLVFESKRQAELIKLNYDENSEFIFKGLLSLFSGDVNYLND